MVQTLALSDSSALCAAKFPHSGEEKGKKTFLSRKRGLDGGICICEIYSVDDDRPTSPTPFPFAAAVLSATHEVHWNQPCMLGVRCEIWGLYKMFHQLEPWVHTWRTPVRHISCTESDAIMSSLNFHIIWKIRVIVQYHSRYESVGESKQNKRSRLGRTVSTGLFFCRCSHLVKEMCQNGRESLTQGLMILSISHTGRQRGWGGWSKELKQL